MRFRKFLKTLGIIAGLEIVTAAVGFMLFIYSAAPVFENLRTLWIETAMTTMSHQWLATAFFPQETIDSVMGKQVVDFDGIGGIDLDLEPEPEESRGPVTLVEQKEIDILGQKFLSVGGLDWAGNEILVNDIDQGIIISDIKSKNYHGWAIIVDDPSRIHMTGTTLRGDRGEQIMDFYDREDAIFACNASGFSDPGGNGSGGHVAGACMMQGELWGNYTSTYVTFGFDDQNRFVVGTFSNWEDYHIRDAAQFIPALIINGEQLISGPASWGLQPRTVMGQRADGSVVFLVVDGRQPGYSTGIAMGQCADILMSYGCVNAAACDGGSSSVFVYNGEIMNKYSTPRQGGRRLPNAWIVTKKHTTEDNSTQDVVFLEKDPAESETSKN